MVRAQPSEMSSSSVMPPKKRERGVLTQTFLVAPSAAEGERERERERERASERFPASLNIDHRIVPRFFSPNLTRQTVKRRE